MNELTLSDVSEALPPNLKSVVDQSFVDTLNAVANDPNLRDSVRENFISYTHVLTTGKYRLQDYLNAVQYVTYVQMGLTKREAYAKTFPARYTELVARGTPEKDIAAYVATYNKGKLVNAILEKALIPAWILYNDYYHEALMVQVDLMKNANSEKVKSDAANSVMTHLTKPKEAVNSQLSITLTESDGMTELTNTMRALAKQQKDLIENGVTAKEIAGASLVPAKVVSEKIIEHVKIQEDGIG